MSTFLITGGAGFIGSHLAETLLDRDQHVLVLDDLSSGSVKNIAHLRSNSRFRFVPESVSALNILAEMVDLADVIVHLAATVGVFNIIESPVRTIVNNIGGTEAVLKAAAKKRKKVIIASTSEVYGKSNAASFREDGDLVFGPTSKSRWSYASSKVVDEFLALAYWREFKVPTVVARLFNTIGPRQTGHYGMVVPRFMSQALRGQNLTVYGSGQQSRCFTYVSDIVEWLLLLASIDKAVGEVFNIGNPKGTVTVLSLAQMIIKACKSNSKIKFVPRPYADIEIRIPSIVKARNLLGYEPKIDLEEGLRRTVAWYRERK